MDLRKEKDKPKGKRKKTTSQLKKELDKWFSLYIRHKYADEQGQVRCYTCGATKAIKEIQNGHFVSRSALSLRYDERNCRAQCKGCNIFGKGRVATFGFKLEQEQKGIVAELYRKAQEITKDYPYQEMIDHYKKRVDELLYEHKGYEKL